MRKRSEKRKFSRGVSHHRAAAGMYLVETLVALTVGAFVSFALLDVVCGSMRTMESSQNEASAAEILDELSEQSRSFGYNRLIYYAGQPIPMVINLTPSSVYADPTLNQRPLFLDLVAKTWRPKTQTSAFGDANQATVSYSVTAGPSSDSLTVTMLVSWLDSRSQLPRSVNRSIVLFKPY